MNYTSFQFPRRNINFIIFFESFKESQFIYSYMHHSLLWTIVA